MSGKKDPEAGTARLGVGTWGFGAKKPKSIMNNRATE